MNIKIVGTGCDKCDRMYENVKKVLLDNSLEAEVEKVEDLMEIVQLGIMSSPTLMIDDKVVISGKDASFTEVEDKILNSR